MSRAGIVRTVRDVQPSLRNLGLPSIGDSTLCQASPMGGLSLASSSASIPLYPINTREETLLKHLPIVKYIARQIHERLPRHVELEDLISAGTIGLIEAVDRFQPTKRVQLKSYAQFRIQGAILDSLRIIDWGSRSLRRKGRAIEEAINVLTMQLERAPMDSEIALQLGMNLLDYQHLLRDLDGLEIGSIHVERPGEFGNEELAYLAGPKEDSPLFIALQSEIKRHLMEAIYNLPAKERDVLFLYYFEELTMAEIGRTLSMATSRVSQLRSSAVLRLRSAMHSASKSKVVGRASLQKNH